MAKVPLRYRSPRSRTIPARIYVSRSGHAEHYLPRRYRGGFEVCVWIGKMGGKTIEGCAGGRNPREALRKALSTTSRKVGKRRGAYAGMR